MAELKFKDGPHKNETLIGKIQLLMDLMFPLVGMKRKEVKIEIEYVSQSEEELVEDRYFMWKHSNRIFEPMSQSLSTIIQKLRD